MHQKSITHAAYRKTDHEQYSASESQKFILEDKGKYIALSQFLSKMHHECIMNQSRMYRVIFRPVKLAFVQCKWRADATFAIFDVGTSLKQILIWY